MVNGTPRSVPGGAADRRAPAAGRATVRLNGARHRARLATDDECLMSHRDGPPSLPDDVFELMWSELSGDERALPYESKYGTLHIGATLAELERILFVWLLSPHGRTIRMTFRPAATVEVDELEVPVEDPRISRYVIATIDVLEDLAGALRAGTTAERARHMKNMADAERRAEEFQRRQIDERLDSL